MNTTTRPALDGLANVPHPAGAVRVYEWENDDQPIGAEVDHVYEETRRFFIGTTRLVSRAEDPYNNDVKIWIDGNQYADGRVERSILVEQLHPDGPLTPSMARELIAVLTAAVNEVDEMASRDQSSAGRRLDIDTRLSSARAACFGGVPRACNRARQQR